MSDKKPVGTKDTAPQNDFEARSAEFLKRYEALVKELQVDVATYPVYAPTDQQGAFITLIQRSTVDLKDAPQKSPFVAE